MKNKIILLLCVAALTFSTTPSLRANDARPSGGAMVFDVVLARPVCFAATIVGSATFLICWPVAAASGSVQKTEDALVNSPAHATFTRPIGDFDDMQD